MSVDALKRRIAALLNMTTANGCTPEEAAAATAKAAALMRDHGLDEASLGMDAADAPYTEDDAIMNQMWGVLGHCSGCVCVVSPSTGRRCYIGRAPGPTIASYLHVFLSRSVEVAVATFARSDGVALKRKPVQTRLVAAFRQGMVDRLLAAIVHHFGLPEPDLIERAERERDRRFTNLSEGPCLSVRRIEGHGDARKAGWAAGDAVTLRRGLGGEAPRRVEGRGRG
jgi:hypothetical protein